MNDNSSKCPYCYNDITGGQSIVVCPKDRALHHAECWKAFENHCAFHGCDGAGEQPIQLIGDRRQKEQSDEYEAKAQREVKEKEEAEKRWEVQKREYQTQEEAKRKRIEQVAQEKIVRERAERERAKQIAKEQAVLAKRQRIIWGVLSISIILFGAALLGGWFFLFSSLPIATQVATRSLTVTEASITTEMPVITKESAGTTEMPVTTKESAGTNEMILIPAGNFIMGSDANIALAECQKYHNDCLLDWFTDEEPSHTVYLDAFWIDQIEVTNALYAQCVNNSACLPPQNTNSFTHSSYYDNPTFNDNPVLYVDWNMAKAYCEWRSARLPTEAEWEKAARGTDGRTYPWGNNPPNDTWLNYTGTVGDTTTVGQYPDGKSIYGSYDMAGNVFEWVNDWYNENYYQSSPSSNPLGPASGTYRILRGGAWYNYSNVVRSANRSKGDPAITNYVIGFRCARSYP